jgi:3-oxoacyl-[acyl-carrier protein] reductase
MHLDFSGQRAIVTGAAQGIGRAIVETLVQSGARVVAIDRDADGLRNALDAGAEAVLTADLGEQAAVEAVCGKALERLGGVDVLAMAAGGVRGQVGKAIETVSSAEWHQLFAANVDSAFWCVQAVAQSMKGQRSGRIVTISSGAGLRPSYTGIQAYAAAKHALVGLTRQLALELGPYGITVNSVAPGFVLSNPASQAQWDSYGDDGQESFLKSVHLRRLGDPQDIANAVAFLASDRASWLTGQVLPVDGGRA